MLGVLLINKPKGITSHDVVQRIRRRFNLRRVGHSGTLDPMAEGLLVLAVGPATRFLQYLPLEPKRYEAVVKFGEATNTFDAEGEVTDSGQVPDDLDDQIAAHLPTLTGEIQQLPPMFSAVKKDGRALYEYARRGEEVERRLRTVFISDYSQTGSPSEAERSFTVECSGGTYIRTLAHDLGQMVGCGAHLTGLVRTQVGKFHLKDAFELESVEPSDLLPLSESLPPMPLVELNEHQTKLVRDGRWIQVTYDVGERQAGLLNSDGMVISVARVEGRELHPECVLPESAPTGSS
jgi:tRNA pseudouridine55 synthase